MTTNVAFKELKLAPSVLSAVEELGYEEPTSIQVQGIPVFMKGEDLLAQAQTGTGKTAAFALPLLSKIDLSVNAPQALIITPTREIAIQVAEAFQSYAKHLKGFHVAPIYGGQAYPIQMRALKRGAHVIVGTPGRMMDHLRRGTISMDAIETVVLDEADEMLKMGFINDIEWILEQIPHDHQTALFSATMSPQIEKISRRYLNDAVKIHIKPTKNTVAAIEQFYIGVSRNQKMDLLTRFLEVEEVQAAIIFTGTKNMSTDLAQRLQARGYAAAALNGDMNQSAREKVINHTKRGTIDIIVATDVAARGIDLDRISHVVNYDIPNDTESYIHRIGRTGRAGRKGKALLFVSPREHHLLRDIERAVNAKISEMKPPSIEQMKEKRNNELAETILGIVERSKKLGPHRKMIENIIEQSEADLDPIDIAAALVYLIDQSNPMPEGEIRTAEAEHGKPERKRRGRSSGGFKGNSSGRSDRRSGGGGRPGGRSGGRSGRPGGDRPGRSEGGRSGRPGGDRSGRSEGERSSRSGTDGTRRSDNDRSGRPSGDKKKRFSSSKGPKKSFSKGRAGGGGKPNFSRKGSRSK